MNDKEKLQAISSLIDDVDKICPYCKSPLESVMLEYNCSSCSQPIYPRDYFFTIKYIINEKNES